MYMYQKMLPYMEEIDISPIPHLGHHYIIEGALSHPKVQPLPIPAHLEHTARKITTEVGGGEGR
jgi:hypothetical protein